MPRATRLTALALPLLLAAACGGGSSGSLSKADYLKRSEAVCSQVTESLSKLPAPTSLTDLPTLVESGVTITSKGTAQLADLAAAQPDSETLDRIFIEPTKKHDQQIKDFLAKLRVAAAKSEDAVKALSTPKAPAVDAAAMTTYGFKTCVALSTNG